MNAGSIRRPSGNAATDPPALTASRNRSFSDMDGAPGESGARRLRLALSPVQLRQFHALYRDNFDFVYRNLRRLGVPSGSIDDALQEVYLVVLRRIDDYREGSAARAWLFAIAARVAGNQRRSERRRGELVSFVEPRMRSASPSPFELLARTEAGQVLHAFLATLDDAHRAVFVMIELEQMTAPEVARALSMNLNSVYSRVRAARAELVRMLTTADRRTGGSGG